MKPPRRILIVKPSSLGDVVHTLPLVTAIHHHWPESEICWIIHPAWRFLVEGHPAVSETILFPRDKFRGIAGWLRALTWICLLRDCKPELALDLQGLLRSAIFARISGAEKVVGLSDAREGSGFLYHESGRVNRNDHAVRRYLVLLDQLGIPQPEKPEFELPEGNLPQGFHLTKPYLVLHPYARGQGKSLGDELIRAFTHGAAPYRVIIVGRGEPTLNLPDHVEDWSNKTDLLELIGILRRASFIVSSDSGPMHLAAALHPAKTLAIHLWSDPLKVGPCFPESLVWKSGKISLVSELNDSWRSEGRPPTASEMEELGKWVTAEKVGMMNSE